jgi:chromate transporter
MTDDHGAPARGSPLEVFWAFLGLGLTAFGGPIAHIGYFRRAFVERRAWLGEAAYADIVALCQFLPGPASSQVGFSLGLMRAGWLGGLAAWCGFTLPSAALMLAFAWLQPQIAGGGLGAAAIHGLKLTAVAVVAQALLGMARSLCPDARRASIAVAALTVVVATPVAFGQIAAIGMGALAGLIFCRNETAGAATGKVERLSVRARPWLTITAVVLFAALFVPGALVFGQSPHAALFHAFYKSGALVFGGGHVVLPLLRAQTVATGWVSDNAFLAGYGAAQAMPGPLFTFAAYLGDVSKVGGGPAGAAIGLAAIFLPGLLLVAAVLPYWSRLQRIAPAQAAMRGAGAAVVGILALAFYTPVFTSGVGGLADLAIAAIGFVLLTAWKAPPLAVVVFCTASAVALAALGG